MKTLALPSRKELHELFEYRDGRLYWKKARSGVRKGSAAGSPGHNGYIRVRIHRTLYAVHRVIWVMHHGEIPEGMTVDHRDLDKRDNRIENLRLVSHRENSIAGTARRRSNNRTGVIGVSFNRRAGRYHAHIRIEGKHLHLGSFLTLDAAAAARRAAEIAHGYADLYNRPAA